MMTINPNSILAAVRHKHPAGSCELIEGKNNRFMIQVSQSPAFVVIEFDGAKDVGLSRVRTHAESWLAGHEVVLEEPTVEEVLNSLGNLLDESE